MVDGIVSTRIGRVVSFDRGAAWIRWTPWNAKEGLDPWGVRALVKCSALELLAALPEELP